MKKTEDILKFKTHQHAFALLIGRKSVVRATRVDFFPPSAAPAELQLQISLKRKKKSWMYIISVVIPTKSVAGVNDQFVKALTALSWEWPILRRMAAQLLR